MKISDFVIQTLVDLGITSAFSVTGGATMHLNDSVGQNPKLQVVYMHHEQSCAMAAEGYARIARKPALVIVTAGPGGINALNGVFGAYTDSIPMVVLSGQSRKDTQKSNFGLSDLRQLGDQEAPILDLVRNITKSTHEVTSDLSGSTIRDLVTSAYKTAVSGRPGPVWIEIPVDVQAVEIAPPESSNLQLIDFASEQLSVELETALALLDEKLRTSNRPVLLLGSGVQISDTCAEAVSFAETYNIPVLTAWSHDVISSDHKLFFGRPGTIGTRPGNMILQNSDLLVVLGSRLNIRQISYNYENFAPRAYKIQVDVDKGELNKPFPKIDLGIHCDLRLFFQFMSSSMLTSKELNSRSYWLRWCRSVRTKYAIKAADYPVANDSINAYHLIPELILNSKSNSIFVCGDATACIVPFQTAHLKEEMNMFSNSGCASMGYDLPAAIGAAQANPNRPVVCFAGDGSLMMNIQELQTLASSKLNILLVILDNGGYLSIKQTQLNFFGRLHGATPESGISFPHFDKVCRAFGLPTKKLNPKNWREEAMSFLSMSKPRVLVAKLNKDQEFIPRIKSKIVNGLIQTPTLEDMYPHLDTEELQAVMNGVKL